MYKQKNEYIIKYCRGRFPCRPVYGIDTKNLILWQRNSYDHIIRNEKEYQEIWSYIETNPLKWEEDEYYI